jgi:hypothetical protein
VFAGGPSVFSEGCCRDFQLLGKRLHKWFGGLLELSEPNARMAQECELDREANSVGVPPTARHQVLVGPGQGEPPRHAIWVKRNAEKRASLLVGQQLSNCHLCPLVDG